MSGLNLNPNALVDSLLRGVATAAVYRGVWQGKPVFAMGTVNDGMKFAGANILYDVVRPLANQVLPAAINLPNGGK